MNPTTDIHCVIKVEPQESPVLPTYSVKTIIPPTQATKNKSILQTETGVKQFQLKIIPKQQRPKRSKTKRPSSAEALDKPKQKWTKGGYKGGYKCLVCLKSFNDPSNFNRHKRTHWDEEKKHKYNCTACTMSFTRSDNLKKHFEISHMQDTETKPGIRASPTILKKVGGANFKRNFLLRHCDMCSYTTHLKSSLESHVINKHVVDKEFPCEHCTRMFIDEHSVARHVRQSHSPRFKCDTCSKLFSKKYIFDQHLIDHSGTKPFVCSVCDHPFNSKSALLAHTKKNHRKRVKTERRPSTVTVLTNSKQSKFTTKKAKSETKMKKK